MHAQQMTRRWTHGAGQGWHALLRIRRQLVRRQLLHQMLRLPLRCSLVLMVFVPGCRLAPELGRRGLLSPAIAAAAKAVSWAPDMRMQCWNVQVSARFAVAAGCGGHAFRSGHTAHSHGNALPLVSQGTLTTLAAAASLALQLVQTATICIGSSPVLAAAMPTCTADATCCRRAAALEALVANGGLVCQASTAVQDVVLGLPRHLMQLQPYSNLWGRDLDANSELWQACSAYRADPETAPLPAPFQWLRSEVVAVLELPGVVVQLAELLPPPPAADPQEQQLEAAGMLGALRCANVACTNISDGSEGSLRSRHCSGCGTVRYRGEACNRAGWRAHRRACSLLQAVAAAGQPAE